jgi:hypothetical protein
MRTSSSLTACGAITAIALIFMSAPSNAADPPVKATAAERLNGADAQTDELAGRAGTWDVVMTLQPAADATPIVTRALVAERRMVGRFREEIIHPSPGTKTPQFQRISYLQYSSVEGRWQYVSLDTRFPVGIMPAYSFDKGERDKITLEFAPIGFVGMGADVEGKMLRSNLVITYDGKDHEVVQQFWTTSDGTGRTWLGVSYDYRRRR